MAHGTEDHYSPDAQLAEMLTKVGEMITNLESVITDLDLVVISLGDSLWSISSDMKDLIGEIRTKGMGEATSLHASGSGTVGTGALNILAAWTGRTGFSVVGGNLGAGYLYVGASTACGMGKVAGATHFINETYCGAIYIKGSAAGKGYAFEEW